MAFSVRALCHDHAELAVVRMDVAGQTDVRADIRRVQYFDENEVAFDLVIIDPHLPSAARDLRQYVAVGAQGPRHFAVARTDRRTPTVHHDHDMRDQSAAEALDDAPLAPRSGAETNVEGPEFGRVPAQQRAPPACR